MNDLASAIEHTLLAPEARAVDFDRLVDEALQYGLFGVCVPSSRVAHVRARLERRRDRGAVRLVTVVGYPNGAIPVGVKREEMRVVVGEGADEIDVVASLGTFRDGNHAACVDELATIVAAAGGRPVKLILETGLLDDDEKRALGELAIGAGVSFLKTSTGIPGRGGATVHDVALLHALAAGRVRVKASGGIRTRSDVMAMLAAGANRIGTSAGPRIVTEGDLG